MDVVGVQQVLSLSSAAEKVQQTTQQRGDIANYNAVTSKQEEDADKSNANPPTELTRETRFHGDRDSRRDRKRNAGKSVKKSPGGDESMESEEVEPPSDCGNVLDIIA